MRTGANKSMPVWTHIRVFANIHMFASNNKCVPHACFCAMEKHEIANVHTRITGRTHTCLCTRGNVFAHTYT